MALIALAGGLATSLWLLRRIDAISLASREIMAGDLSRRIALHGNGDEFDRLAAGLNVMLDRIQELMRGLQQVSSDIAHDLRTPLTRLRQRLELARRRSGSIAEYQAAIDAAIGDSEGILDLFAALLRIAQIESGTRRAGFAPVELSALLTDLAETYGPELEAAGQTLTLWVEAGLCLRGDRHLLAQLFANLIENARRHCPAGTHVRLEAWLQDGTEVHFPPHMGGDVLAAVRPGSTVQVRSVRPRGVAMVAAVSIVPEEGARIVDAGPPDDDEGRKAARKRARASHIDMEAQGVVRQLLHGPKGEVRGVLLEDGRAGRFPPHTAQDIAAMIVPNMTVLLRGEGLATPHGSVIAVREIGTSASDLQPVEGKKPKKGHKEHKPHQPGLHAARSGDTHPL